MSFLPSLKSHVECFHRWDAQPLASFSYLVQRKRSGLASRNKRIGKSILGM